MRENRPLDELTYQVIGAAIEVHNALGPGLLEKIYVRALAVAIAERGLSVRTEVPLHTSFNGKDLGCSYYEDLEVNDVLIVEVQAVDVLLQVHIAQAISYVKLANKPAGLLINFHVRRLVDGVRRILNDQATGKIHLDSKTPSLATAQKESP